MRDTKDHEVKTNITLAGKKALILISGGIDSPVAAHLMIRAGMKVDAAHFDNEHLCKPTGKSKVKDIIKILNKKHGTEIKLFIFPHSHSQEQFKKNCDNSFQCVLCKRMMVKIASLFAHDQSYDYLITGDNLGQVASQTLSNMKNIDSATDITVLRPLLSYDKNEIINIAKEIGTYETSIIPGDCCKYVPKRPKTQTTESAILRQEEKVDIKDLSKRSIEKINKISTN